jgi:hypothetical protein
MDNLSVTREEFRVAMNSMLQYLAGALGNVSGTYTTEAIEPAKVILQGQPQLENGATPADDDSSDRIPTTAWVKKNGVTSGDAAPGSPVIGQIWYDTLNDELKFWNGTDWEVIASGGSAGDLTGIDAGAGIAVTDEDTATPKVSVDLGEGLETDPAGDDGTLRVKLDGTTIARGADGISLGTGVAGGSLSTPVTALAAGAGGFDLSQGNFWTNALAAGTEIPAPTNAVAGTSGLIWTTTQANSWNAAFDHPAGTITDAAANSIIPFYIETGGASPKVLLGYPTAGIA